MVDRKQLESLVLKGAQRTVVGAFAIVHSWVTRNAASVEAPLVATPSAHSRALDVWTPSWPPTTREEAGQGTFDLRDVYEVVPCARCQSAGRLPCGSCRGAGTVSNGKGGVVRCGIGNAGGTIGCSTCATRGRMLRFTRVSQASVRESTTAEWTVDDSMPEGPSSGTIVIEHRQGFLHPNDAEAALRQAASGRLSAPWVTELAQRMLAPSNRGDARLAWTSVTGDWFDGWELECELDGRALRYFVPDTAAKAVGSKLRSTKKVGGLVGGAIAALAIAVGAVSWKVHATEQARLAQAAAIVEQARVAREHEVERQRAALPGALARAAAVLDGVTSTDGSKLDAEATAMQGVTSSLAGFDALQPPPAELSAMSQRLAAASRLNGARALVPQGVEQSKKAEAQGDGERARKQYLDADTSYRQALEALAVDDADAKLLQIDLAAPRARMKQKIASIAGPVASEHARQAREEKARAATAAKAEAEKNKREAYAAICGPAPERSEWDGEVFGIARALKRAAHDPDSIEVTACTVPELHAKTCWHTTCQVRGKNAFGAKIVNVKTFSVSRLGVSDL